MVTEADTINDYVPIAESARKVRKALHAAFPKVKISVQSRGDIRIEWEDTGPAEAEVRTSLETAGLAEVRYAWNDDEYLRVDGHNLWFTCFNRARRETAQQDFERRQIEYAAEQERERGAIVAAQEAKRAARPERSLQRSGPPDPAVYEAFELLRQKAEAQVVDHNGDRRPSWAPPLILGDELAEACLSLGYLTGDDKPIGRLWAHFASPKRSGRFVREHVSRHPLHGIACRGFQLFAGGERGSSSAILFEAQRREDGTWQFGPYLYPHEYTSPKRREWESLIRERERLNYHQTRERVYKHETERLALVTAEIAAIDAEDATAAEKYSARQQLKQRTLELARTRVLDFVWTPDAQMQAAGRLWGHCCRCGKALTDPISLERGIGPDCYDKIIWAISMMGANGERPEVISFLVGMPLEVVNAVLSEIS